MRMHSGFKLGGKKSFTLIELLVVIAIIGLLAAMILPALQRARMQARAVVKYSSCMAGQMDKATGRVGHWTLGEGGGSKTKDWAAGGYATISDGNDNEGKKSPRWYRGHEQKEGYFVNSSRFGKEYSSLEFGRVGPGGGSDQGYVDCGTSPELNIRDNFSAEVWVCVLTGPCRAGIFSKAVKQGSSITGWGLYTGCEYTDSFIAAAGSVSLTAYPADSVGIMGMWHHLVLTYQGSGMCILYVNGRQGLGGDNGEPSAPGEGPLADNLNTSLIIGSSGEQARMLVDEAIFYNRVLDKYEVADHYNMSAPSGYPIVTVD